MMIILILWVFSISVSILLFVSVNTVESSIVDKLIEWNLMEISFVMQIICIIAMILLLVRNILKVLM